LIRWCGSVVDIDKLCWSSVENRGSLLVFRYAVEAVLGACGLESRLCLCGAAIEHRCLCLTVLPIDNRDVVWRHGTQALRRNNQSHAGCVLGRTSCWSQGTFEVPSGTSRTGELLVALSLRLRTVAARNGCPTG
jgi:hypothetical protein